MPTFGDFESYGEPLAVTEELGHVSTVWRASKVGGRGDPNFAIKCYAPHRPKTDDAAADEALDRDRSLEFLEGVKQVKKTQAQSGRCLVPIHDFGVTHECAWYVTDYYPRNTLKAWVAKKGGVDSAGLRRVVQDVVAGCLALKHSRGYSHGNLKAANVFLVGAPRPLRSTPLKLADAYPAAPLQLARLVGEERRTVDTLLHDVMEVQDLRALGELLLQLVEGRVITNQYDYNYPIAATPEWERLGRDAGRWRELCNRLLDPQLSLDKLSLESLAREFKAGVGSGKTLKIAAMAGAVVLLLAAIGGGWVWNENRLAAQIDKKASAAAAAAQRADWKLAYVNASDVMKVRPEHESAKGIKEQARTNLIAQFTSLAGTGAQSLTSENFPSAITNYVRAREIADALNDGERKQEADAGKAYAETLRETQLASDPAKFKASWTQARNLELRLPQNVRESAVNMAVAVINSQVENLFTRTDANKFDLANEWLAEGKLVDPNRPIWNDLESKITRGKNEWARDQGKAEARQVFANAIISGRSALTTDLALARERFQTATNAAAKLDEVEQGRARAALEYVRLLEGLQKTSATNTFKTNWNRVQQAEGVQGFEWPKVGADVALGVITNQIEAVLNKPETNRFEVARSWVAVGKDMAPNKPVWQEQEQKIQAKHMAWEQNREQEEAAGRYNTAMTAGRLALATNLVNARREFLAASNAVRSLKGSEQAPANAALAYVSSLGELNKAESLEDFRRRWGAVTRAENQLEAQWQPKVGTDLAVGVISNRLMAVMNQDSANRFTGASNWLAEGRLVAPNLPVWSEQGDKIRAAWQNWTQNQEKENAERVFSRAIGSGRSALLTNLVAAKKEFENASSAAEKLEPRRKEEAKSALDYVAALEALRQADANNEFQTRWRAVQSTEGQLNNQWSKVGTNLAVTVVTNQIQSTLTQTDPTRFAEARSWLAEGRRIVSNPSLWTGQENLIIVPEALSAADSKLTQAQQAFSRTNYNSALTLIKDAGAELDKAEKINTASTGNLRNALIKLQGEAQAAQAQDNYSQATTLMTAGNLTNATTLAKQIAADYPTNDDYRTLTNSISVMIAALRDATNRFNAGDYRYLETTAQYARNPAFTNLINQGQSEQTEFNQLAPLTNSAANWQQLNDALARLHQNRRALWSKPPFQSLAVWAQANNPLNSAMDELNEWKWRFRVTPNRRVEGIRQHSGPVAQSEFVKFKEFSERIRSLTNSPDVKRDLEKIDTAMRTAGGGF